MFVHILSRISRVLLLWVCLLPAAVVVGGCSERPTLKQCKEALRNRIELFNADDREARDDALREVDRLAPLCAKGMKRESIQCDIDAKSVQDLKKCR